jgi:hypothetical protein
MSPKTKKVARKKAGRMPEKKVSKSPTTSKRKGEIDDKDLDQIAGGLTSSSAKVKLY